MVLKDAPLEHMKSTIQLTGQLGAKLKRSGMDIKIEMENRPEAIKFVHTAPYPGFPTDLQSPLLAVLSKARGNSCIEERLFENRFLIEFFFKSNDFGYALILFPTIFLSSCMPKYCTSWP